MGGVGCMIATFLLAACLQGIAQCTPHYNSTEVSEQQPESGHGQDRTEGHSPPLWNPPPARGMTRDEFMETHGMGRAELARVKRLTRRLKREMARKAGHRGAVPRGADEFVDDLLFTREQLEYLLVVNRARKKRTIAGKRPFRKWTGTTLKYAFDGNHNSGEQDIIRAAIAHWESRTCLRFREYQNASLIQGHYILFARNNTGCWASVGQIESIASPQIINLQSTCLANDQLRIPIHEIGHTVGLSHEHSRHDRDEYVVINIENVQDNHTHNFQKNGPEALLTSDLNYDMGSVMHYSTNAFAKNPNISTIEPRNPLYKATVGSNFYLTFFDSRRVNLAYCNDSCSTSRPLACERGGYVDPSDCSRCVCPEGFGGVLCGTVEASVGGKCRSSSAGEVRVNSDTESCIDFGNYSNQGLELSCNWHLKAPVGCRIDFRFTSLHTLNRSDGTCRHFVVVKVADELRSRGARFCSAVPDLSSGGMSPSPSNEVMVMFRSPYPYAREQPGFRMCYKLKAGCIHANPTSKPNNESERRQRQAMKLALFIILRGWLG